MIGALTAGFTKEGWIEKRVAEGFTKEQAVHEYDNYTDPAIKEAQKQKVDTRGEQIQRITDAMMKNPDKNKLFAPNFAFSSKYEELAKKDTSNMSNKERENRSKALLGIQIRGTISKDEIQDIIDKALNMPIASVIAEIKQYEAQVTELEGKVENYDTSVIQRKVDALTAEYQKKYNANRGRWYAIADLQREYEEKVDELEKELTKPINELKIKRWEAMTYKRAYDYVLKGYIAENKDLIEAEILEAKKREVRGALADLAPYVEG